MSDNKNSLPYEVEVIKNLVNANEIKETHISYALLTDEYVYKIKKPVDFGFINYTELKDRKFFSILEKDLNDRFSKDIYLDVLKLSKKTATEFSLEPLESSLFAVEYILKMKRINDADFLLFKLSNNSISLEAIEQVGIEVATLLSNLDNAPMEQLEGFISNYDTVHFNAVENFNQTEQYLDKLIDKDIFNFIKLETDKFLTKHKDIFNLRFKDGYVKNGHGDLRLDHIYFNSDGSVGLIDCIEFNKRFRFNDIISEAAFLSMELDYQGMIDISDAFLKGFLSILNDPNSLLLLNYYKSYLAYVRAKIAAITLEQLTPSTTEYNKKLLELKRLINFSAYYILIADNPMTLLFFGTMATGKSKNAKMFSETFPVRHLASDEIRKKSLNINPTEKVYIEFNEGIYSKEMSNKLYNEISDKLNDNIRLGRGSIIDASFADPEYYNIVKSKAKSRLFKIKFTAPESLINERLKSRLNKKSISDGRPAISEIQKQTATFPSEDILIVTDGDINDNINKIFSTIINKNNEI